MPTYEYACRSCGEHLEVVQSFKDEPLSECPRCEGQLRKVFSPIGITFKGSGFYKTDSRSTGSKRSSANESKSESKSESKGESKSESSSSPSSSSSSGSDGGSGSSSSSSSEKSAAAS